MSSEEKILSVFICIVSFKAAAANLRGGPRGENGAAESPSYFTHQRW